MTGSVLAVGGGIAGRAVARVLARHGLSCSVVERRERLSRGMGINLPGNGVRALAELDVLPEALAGGVPVRRREYRNGKGRLLFAVDDQLFWREVAPSVCLRHGDLLNALAFPEEVHVAHIGAVGARPTPTGVEVELDRAPPHSYDFVIGADGVHSTMRKAMRAIIADDGLRPSSMTGSSWRFIADYLGIDCSTAWSGRDETFLLIPPNTAASTATPPARAAAAPARPELVDEAAEAFPAVVEQPSARQSPEESCIMPPSTRCA